MSTPRKPALFPSIFSLRCSRCRRGKMFKTPTFTFTKPFDMHSHCPKCSGDLEPEPGFYFGAMFISYGISAWPLLGLTFFFRYVMEWSLMKSFFVTTLVTAFFFVYIFRLSRAMYLAMMIKYNEGRAKLAEEQTT